MADELKKKFQEMQEAKHGKKSDILVDEFEWIELNKQLSVDRQTGVKHQETPNEKLMRKFKENPLIPLGAALTTGFLVNGLIKFGRRDSAASQVMMRGRIAAQGFTICALMAGVMVEVRNKTWVKPTGPEEYKALAHQQNYSLPQGIPLLGSETDSKKGHFVVPDIMSKVISFVKNNQLTIGMGVLLVGGHIGWRAIQDQEEFVPKGTQKEYPWIEISRHYKNYKNSQKQAAEATQTSGE